LILFTVTLIFIVCVTQVDMLFLFIFSHCLFSNSDELITINFSRPVLLTDLAQEGAILTDFGVFFEAGWVHLAFAAFMCTGHTNCENLILQISLVIERGLSTTHLST